MTYSSVVEIASSTFPGVMLLIERMSFGRRLELARQIREVASRHEFLLAAESESERMEARLLAGEVERLYVLWGLKEVKGLEIDGIPATPSTLIERGPEELVREAVSAIVNECWLTDEERKN